MTYREAYRNLRNVLEQGGIDGASGEAHTMLAELCGIDRMKLLSEDELPEKDRLLLTEAAKRRCLGEPLQYILGHWYFMDREFAVGEGVLIPRDDTEVAVRTCQEALKGLTEGRVVDLCAGSGIIAVTLARLLPRLHVTAVELSGQALEYLYRNAGNDPVSNLQIMQGDIFACHRDFDDGSLAAIVSNPPYIASAEIPTLQKEIGFEPVMALDGGEDGLDFYRCIARYWIPKLRSGGSLTLEIGETQAESVCILLAANGIGNIRVIKDIQGLDRVIFGTK